MTQPTTKLIQAYSIFEYTQKIQEAINEGYYFELDTNEGTPLQFGFHYEVTMYKKELKSTQKEDTYVASIPPEFKEDVKSALEAVAKAPQKHRGRTAK